jgi:hypothetical protein
LAPSLAQGQCVLVSVQWLQGSPGTVAFFGGMSKVDALPKVVEVSSLEVGANVGHWFSNAVSQEQGNTIVKR